MACHAIGDRSVGVDRPFDERVEADFCRVGQGDAAVLSLDCGGGLWTAFGLLQHTECCVHDVVPPNTVDRGGRRSFLCVLALIGFGLPPESRPCPKFRMLKGNATQLFTPRGVLVVSQPW